MSHGLPAAPARADMPDVDMDAPLPAAEEPRPSLAEQFRKARALSPEACFCVESI